MSRKAFTLIELLVVIAIIALLSSVVLASLNSARNKGTYGAAKYLTAQMDHVLGDGGVGGWDFDECSGSTAANRFGASNAGSLINMVPGSWSSTNTPNGQGCSLIFNGVDQYVSAGDVGGYATNFSVSGWIYKTTFSGFAEWTAFGKRNAVAAGYQLGVTSAARVIFRVFNGGTQQNFSFPTVLAANKWYHVLASYTDQSVTVYINGLKDGTYSGYTINPGIDTTAFSIGHIGVGGGGSYWEGQMDGVRVYNSVLSAADAKRLYAEGLSNHPVASSLK